MPIARTRRVEHVFEPVALRVVPRPPMVTTRRWRTMPVSTPWRSRATFEAAKGGKESSKAVAKTVRQGRASLATKADIDSLEMRLEAKIAAHASTSTARCRCWAAALPPSWRCLNCSDSPASPARASLGTVRLAPDRRTCGRRKDCGARMIVSLPGLKKTAQIARRNENA